jgi:hypothetical protein
MDLTPVLDQIRAAGVHLGVGSGKLVCAAPPSVMTPKRRAWLEQHKAELVELLKPEPEAATGDELICWTEQSDVSGRVLGHPLWGKRECKASRDAGAVDRRAGRLLSTA